VIVHPTDSASNIGALLDAALDYAAHGWSIIPTAGKRPRFGWKDHQRERPGDKLLRDWFGGRFDGISGLAVVLGSVSGGLAVRDFDDLGSYSRWAAAHPRLAATLPTVETGRGRHIYFRGPERFANCGDGEYRGDPRHYCVLPPSRHPSGHTYRWLIPPHGDLPAVDPVKAGLCNREQQRRTERTENTPTTASVLSVALCPSLLQAVEQAIAITLPATPGVRQRCVFRLARQLKGIPALAGAAAGTLRPIVEQWHRLAVPVIRTKPFLETWADFLLAWPRVRVPAGEDAISTAFRRAAATTPPPRATELYGSGPIVLLAALCRELQRLASDGDFFLDCRTAGRLIGVDHTTAWRYLVVLCADGVLAARAKGSKATRKASRFRFIDPEQEGTDQ
jgi:hypothetical protein